MKEQPRSQEPVIALGNYRLDGEPRALYWLPYRAKYEEIKKKIAPGQRITPDLGITVAMMGNSALNWNSFDLKKQDRMPLGGVSYPGKSAHIDFTNSLDLQTDIDLNILCDAILNRKKARRTDHLWVATVEDIRSANYNVFYTPQPNHPLHLRIVHTSQMNDNPPHDIKHSEKQAIMEVFRKIR